MCVWWGREVRGAVDLLNRTATQIRICCNISKDLGRDGWCRCAPCKIQMTEKKRREVRKDKEEQGRRKREVRKKE